MSNSSYDQHRAAFSNVSAYVIMFDGERVATVALKFPRDGASRLYAYVHVFGSEMVRGFASGGGYDKRSAAVMDAVRKLKPWSSANGMDTSDAVIALMQKALSHDGGHDWARYLTDVKFEVLQAV